MPTGTALGLTIFVAIAIAILIQFLIWKVKQKDKQTIDETWQKFLKASSAKDIDGLIFYGDKLIWNKFLNQNQLSKMKEIVDTEIVSYPDLKELKLKVLNKDPF